MENEKRTMHDPNLSVSSTVSGNTTDEEVKETEEKKNSENALSSLITNASPIKEEPKEELSPLDKAIMARNSGTGGLKVDNNEPEEALRNPIDTDERRKELKEKVEELDDMTIRTKAIVGVLKPESAGEFAQMMDEIEQIQIDPETKEVTFIPQSKWFIPKTAEVEEEIKKINEMKEKGEEYEVVFGDGRLIEEYARLRVWRSRGYNFSDAG